MDNLEAENHLIDELLGEFDGEVMDKGKSRILRQLEKIQVKLETIQVLDDEV